MATKTEFDKAYASWTPEQRANFRRMAGAAPAAPKGGTPSWMSAYGNPGATPLPPGLAPDAAYQAFLRGMGATFQQASATTLQQIAAAKAAYVTASGRLPGELEENIDKVNAELGDRGLWFSGERLEDVARQRVLNQQKAEDLIAARAQAIQAAKQQFGSTVSQLGQQRAEAVGQLQARTSAQQNQNRYIDAVRGANSGGGGGGGSITVTVPGTAGGTAPSSGPGPAAPPKPATAAPGPPQLRTSERLGPTSLNLPGADYRAGTSRLGYYQGLSPQQQAEFGQWLQFAGQGRFPTYQAAVNDWLMGDPAYVAALRGLSGPPAPKPYVSTRVA